MENYYKLLGLPDYCEDQDQIKKAYRQQVKFYHPDSHNVSPEIAEEKTRKINAAYDVLSDPNKKYQYDNQLRYGETSYQSYSNPNANSQFYNQYYNQYYNQNYSNQSYGNYNNQYYNNTNSNQRGRFVFTPFGFFYTNNGRGTSRRGGGFLWTLIRYILIWNLITFLFRGCTPSYYYYNDYGNYRDYTGEKGSAKVELNINPFDNYEFEV